MLSILKEKGVGGTDRQREEVVPLYKKEFIIHKKYFNHFVLNADDKATQPTTAEGDANNDHSDFWQELIKHQLQN